MILISVNANSCPPAVQKADDFQNITLLPGTPRGARNDLKLVETD